MPFYFVMEQR